MGAYGAAKAGLLAMVTNLQIELEGTGVRASNVHPGPTRTAMGWSLSAEKIGPALQDWAKWGQARHDYFLRAADLARAIAFVAETPRGGFIANLEEFRTDPIALMKRVREECGEVGIFQLADKQVVFLSGAEANEFFFRSSDEDLDQAAAYPFMTPIFGEGVVRPFQDGGAADPAGQGAISQAGLRGSYRVEVDPDLCQGHARRRHPITSGCPNAGRSRSSMPNPRMKTGIESNKPYVPVPHKL